MRPSALVLTALALLLAGPPAARATHGIDTDGDGLVDAPFDPENLELPDRDALDRGYRAVDATWWRESQLDLQCGGHAHVRECEEMGGYVVVEEGLGCKSTVQLYEQAAFGKTRRVVNAAARGKLGVWTLEAGLVPLPRETPPVVVLVSALAGRLVTLRGVLRDVKKLGELAPVGCRCKCVVQKLVGAQVINALKGDVGLVPVNTPGGEDIVVTIFKAIDQRHRHAVIFLGPHRIRHNTSYDEPSEDDLLDNNELKLGPLNNAEPGITTENVEEALANGRLAYEGLLLRPASEFFRPAFEAAADAALGAEGYYKISDYSGLDGMALPYSAPGTNDWETLERKGTMCSGLVHWAFDQAGMIVSEAFYSATLRNDVADVLYDTVKADIGSNLGFWESIGSFFFTGTKKKLANQVVNCFAGLGCDDNTDTWKSGVGSATSVSPDNLLPEDFTLQGTGCAPWGNARICAGDHVVNPDGAPITPFLKIEPMQVLGAHWEEQVLEEW
jgi:hypothetical protein